MKSKISLFSVILSLWHKLRKRRKIQVLGALCLILISGLSEMISLGLVVPFLTVLIDPKLLFDNNFTTSIVRLFNLDQIINLRLIFTVSFALSSLFANSIRLFNIWVITFLSQKIGNDLSSKVFKIHKF